MGLTRSGLPELIERLDAEQYAAMECTGRGSYRVTLSMPGISHSSFSDQPFLRALDEPDKRKEAERHLETIPRSKEGGTKLDRRGHIEQDTWLHEADRYLSKSG
jgi:hypothetical protein